MFKRCLFIFKSPPPIPSPHSLSPRQPVCRNKNIKVGQVHFWEGFLKGGPGGVLRARCVCLKEGGGVRFKREEKNWRFAQSSRGTRVLESVRAQNGEVLLRRRMPKMLRVLINTLANCTADVFFLIQPLGTPSAEQIKDVPEYPAAPKVKVRKLFAAPAFCSLTDVRWPLTCQFCENRRAKLIKNSGLSTTISIGTPDVTLGHSRWPGMMGLERGCVQGQR